MIVDAHSHIFEKGYGGPFDLPASPEALINEMDNCNIDASIVIPLPGVASNEFVAKECRKFKNRLFPLYYPEFECSDMIEKMDDFWSLHKPLGIKIHPRLQNVTVNDNRVCKVLEWAQEKDIPVMFDVFPFGENVDDSSLYPFEYHKTAKQFPKLKIILAHSGGYRLMEGFLTAKANNNIFLDFSLTLKYFENSSIFMDAVFVANRLRPGRILFGTDFPDVKYAEYIDLAFNKLRINDDDRKEAFLGKTAVNIFKLQI